MNENHNLMEVRDRIVSLVEQERLRFTLHAHQEMTADSVLADELLESLLSCSVLENYPDHQRGACCLVCGRTATGRFLHTVCTTGLEELVIITVYEPKPPKWPTPFIRGKQS